MHISEFASKVHESPGTIRFYETIGLLPDPQREPNDYRNYADRDGDRVLLIRTFQATGLALNDIARLLTIRDAQSQIRDDDRRFVAAKQSEIDAKLHMITNVRTELANLSQPATKERPMTIDRSRHQVDDLSTLPEK